MIDLVDALVELLEPKARTTAKIDRSAAQPLDYEANTLYAWIESGQHVSVGTGEVEERFTIRTVYVADNAGETSAKKRLREVSEALDAKAVRYLDRIRDREQAGPWGNLSGTVDHDFIRQLEVRGVSVVVAGWRLLGSVT